MTSQAQWTLEQYVYLSQIPFCQQNTHAIKLNADAIYKHVIDCSLLAVVQIVQPWADQDSVIHQDADNTTGCLGTEQVHEVWQAMEHVHCLSRSATTLKDAQSRLQQLARDNLNASDGHADGKCQLDMMAETLKHVSSGGFDLSSNLTAIRKADVSDNIDFACILGEL